MATPVDYRTELPSAGTLKALLARLVETYKVRDKFIAEMRDALEGKNAIKAPKSMQYKVVVSHTFHLAAIFNEKISRYRRLPELKILPFSSDADDRQKNEAQERALNLAIDGIDKNSDGHVWQAAIMDQNSLDAGVIRVERAPAAFWPEISVLDKTGKNKLMYLYEDADEYNRAKDQYLKQAGIPVRSVYVPLERVYPVFEGPRPVEVLEVEERSLRSVLANPQFDVSGLNAAPGADGGVDQQIVILHYSNYKYHAYYAIGKGQNASNGAMWPTVRRTNTLPLGTPILLHAYEHNLGRVPYVYMGGRGSGWRNGANRIDAVMRALLDLNQDADELHSQIRTFIRNVLWPTRVAYYSPEHRGADDGVPKAPTIMEGETISMWVDEKIENLVANIPEFQLAQWTYDTIKERMSELAGSAALFGQNQSGVYAGYHYQAQVTQSQHLDAMVESSMANAAVDYADLIFRHVRELGEKVYVHAVDKDAAGPVTGKYLFIDNTSLEPWPLLSAKVKDRGPMDPLAAGQAAVALTTVRPGHNTPLASDRYVREMILDIEDPDQMELDIWEESTKRKLLQGEFMAGIVAQRVGMMLAQDDSGQMTPDMVAGASPAVRGAVNDLNTNGEAAQMGGVSPQNLGAMVDGSNPQDVPQGPPQGGPPQGVPGVADTGAAGMRNGMGGGVAAGQPQPMQAAGRIQQILQEHGLVNA